jgi:hypothetical protein
MSSQRVVVHYRDALRSESLPLVVLVAPLSYQSLNYIPHQGVIPPSARRGVGTFNKAIA